jgi:hypothetical protein
MKIKPFRLIAMAFLIAIQIQASAAATISNHKRQTIEVLFNQNIHSQQHDKFKQWVDFSSKALMTVYGEWPMDTIVVRIKDKNGSRGGPVPWGQVSRTTPPELSLTVDEQASLKALKNDWTIYHELSHLLIPYDGYSARWFSEGLASYYQNITQARIGTITERKMWQKLYDGFERGRKQTNYPELTLEEVSDQMRQTRNYMRIYWSGALYWLVSDIELRQAKPDQSLDKALYQLRLCCAKQSLSAWQLARKLDDISGTKIFTRNYQSFGRSHAIPEYLDLLNDLGLSINFDNVQINSTAKLAHIRKAIYQGHK